MTAEEVITRLTKHTTDCVEREALKLLLEQVEQLQRRIQNMISQINYLESELGKRM
jgi:hypothetical protein